MSQEGSLHILRREEDPGNQERYSVAFAPCSRHGGAIPNHVVRSEAELRALLADLGIGEPDVARMLADARRSGRASMPSVALSTDQLKKYGLQEMGILESVILYLST